jgi:cohesin loading factor subunit SCC2
MYSDIVQPTQGTRLRFLSALLKPFDAACNISASQSAAAREDPARLAFCAYVAANLPFKRADEPLVLLHVINSHVSRLAQEVRDVLRRALLRLGLREAMRLDEDDDEEEQQPAATAAATPSQQHAQNVAADAANSVPAEQGDSMLLPQPPPRHHPQHQVSLPLKLPLPQWLAAPVKASLGLSMLLVLKQYLMAAYSLSDERVAQYEMKGEKARAEAKAMASKSKKMADFGLNVIDLRAVQDGTGELLAKQYMTYAGLLDNDAANYR